MALKRHNEFNDVTGSCDLQILLGALCLSIQMLAGFSEIDLHYRNNKSWCDMEIFKILKHWSEPLHSNEYINGPSLSALCFSADIEIIQTS